MHLYPQHILHYTTWFYFITINIIVLSKIEKMLLQILLYDWLIIKMHHNTFSNIKAKIFVTKLQHASYFSQTQHKSPVYYNNDFYVAGEHFNIE